MSILKGRNTKVEVALTYDAADTITGLTAAKPPVVSSTAHAQANNDVGYLTALVGGDAVDGQAYVVASTAANTFELKGADFSSYSISVTGGSAIRVATWATLAKATNVSIDGGSASQLDTTVLLDTVKQNEAGMLDAQTVSVDMYGESGTPAALDAIRSAALSGGYVIVRMTYPTGDVRVFRGQVGLPSESVSVDSIATQKLNFTVKRSVVFA